MWDWGSLSIWGESEDVTEGIRLSIELICIPNYGWLKYWCRAYITNVCKRKT